LKSQLSSETGITGNDVSTRNPDGSVGSSFSEMARKFKSSIQVKQLRNKT